MHADAAERPHRFEDALVVGGDEHRRHRRGGGRAPVDVLDHRPAADVGERLARQAVTTDIWRG